MSNSNKVYSIFFLFLTVIALCIFYTNDKQPRIHINELIINEKIYDQSENTKLMFKEKYEPEIKKYLKDSLYVDSFFSKGALYTARLTCINELSIDNENYFLTITIPTVVFSDGVTYLILENQGFIDDNQLVISTNGAKSEFVVGRYEIKSNAYGPNYCIVKVGDICEMYVHLDFINTDNSLIATVEETFLISI